MLLWQGSYVKPYKSFKEAIEQIFFLLVGYWILNTFNTGTTQFPEGNDLNT